MSNEEKKKEMIFLISEEAQRFIQTADKVKAFESVEYKKNNGTMSLLECIKTIVKGKYARIDVKDGILSISDLSRTYNVTDFDCPEPDMFDFPATVTVSTQDGNYEITYHFERDEKDLSSVTICHKEQDGTLKEVSRVYRMFKPNGELDTLEELKEKLPREVFAGEEK